MRRSKTTTQPSVVCPSCHASIRLRPGQEPLDICPQCGEWIVSRGHGRHIERWDDFSERESGNDGSWNRSPSKTWNDE